MNDPETILQETPDEKALDQVLNAAPNADALSGDLRDSADAGRGADGDLYTAAGATDGKESGAPEGSRQERIADGKAGGGETFVETVRGWKRDKYGAERYVISEQQAERFYYYWGYVREKRFPKIHVPFGDILGLIHSAWCVMAPLITDRLRDMATARKAQAHA